MLYAYNVSATAAYDFAHFTQLAGTILQSDNEVCPSAAGNLTAGDYARKNINVNVTAGYNANGFLALNRQLPELRLHLRQLVFAFLLRLKLL